MNNTAKITINDNDYTPNLILPIKWSNLLDERLDECYVRLAFCREKVLAASSYVKIEFTINVPYGQSETEVVNYIIAKDISFERPAGSGLYTHELYLIEETKFMEGIIVDSITFTNNLGKVYVE